MKLGIQGKLVVAFLVASVITLIVGITGYLGVQNMGHYLDDFNDIRLPSMHAMGLMAEGQTAVLRSERSLLHKLPEEDAKRLRKRMDESWVKLEKGWKIYEPLRRGTEEDAAWKEFQPLFEKWKKEHQQVMELLDTGRREEALALSFAAPAKSFNAAQAVLFKILDIIEKRAKLANEESIKLEKQIKALSVAVTLAGFIISILLGYFIARGIKRTLGGEPEYVNELVNEVANGNLTVAVKLAANDTGSTLHSVREMVQRLQEIVGQSVEAANQVSIAADQIAEANQSFSQKITEQAASVEETTAAMEEMGASTRSTAENAREANSLARTSRSVAEQGTVVMADTISAMSEINRSSTKIANISDVIGEIAFQTNLLALNAAVEAARAGEHGKGFAVVAAEIRSLAQRTTASAKEITALIEDSGEKTSRGVQLAEELSNKLNEIVTGIKKVTDLMDEVAAAAQEQSSGINQVNTAMTQVDQTTQQNASLVEETSASTEELAAQARALLDLVSFFRVDQNRISPAKRGVANGLAAARLPQPKQEGTVRISHNRQSQQLPAGNQDDFSDF